MCNRIGAESATTTCAAADADVTATAGTAAISTAPTTAATTNAIQYVTTIYAAGKRTWS